MISSTEFTLGTFEDTELPSKASTVAPILLGNQMLIDTCSHKLEHSLNAPWPASPCVPEILSILVELNGTNI